MKNSQTSAKGRNKKAKNIPKRGGRSYNKDMDKKESTSCKEEFVTNDPSWYMQYPILLDSAGTYKFNTPVGMPINIGKDIPSLSVPGIMVLNTHVAPGIALDVDSPINVQARRLYTYMRASRSGSAAYDPSDVMTYLLAIDSAYCFYFAMKRMVGCVNRSDANNRYLPEHLVAALGFNYSEVQKNVANLTSYLQTYAARLSSFYVPSDMTFLMRHSTIFSNIYMDQASYKSQFYVYNPSGYYVYDELSTPNQPARLRYSRFANLVNTVNDIYSMGESLIRPLVASGDINQISTDIYNAFNNRGLYTVADIPMYYMVAPVYDLEMLNQIQNAKIVGRVSKDEITQDVDAGILKFNPLVGKVSRTEQSIPITASTILSVNREFTDPSHVMTSTRLCANMIVSTDNNIYISSCGSEFVEDTIMYYTTWDATTGEPVLSDIVNDNTAHIMITTDGKFDFNDVIETTENLGVMNTFDYHPLLTVWRMASVGGKPYFVTLSFNYDYFTVLDDNELNKLHYAALLSEFFVPQP